MQNKFENFNQQFQQTTPNSAQSDVQGATVGFNNNNNHNLQTQQQISGANIDFYNRNQQPGGATGAGVQNASYQMNGPGIGASETITNNYGNSSGVGSGAGTGAGTGTGAGS